MSEIMGDVSLKLRLRLLVHQWNVSSGVKSCRNIRIRITSKTGPHSQIITGFLTAPFFFFTDGFLSEFYGTRFSSWYYGTFATKTFTACNREGKQNKSRNEQINKQV